MRRHDASLAAKQSAVTRLRPQVVEAQPQQLAHGLGGVPVTGVVGVEHPAELGLHPRRLLLDLGLGPGVPDLDHQVADDRAVELDDQDHGEPVGVRELDAVLLDRRGGGREPPTDLGEPPVLPGRVEVVDGDATQGQPGGAHRPRHGIQRAAHRPMVSAGRAARARPSCPARHRRGGTGSTRPGPRRRSTRRSRCSGRSSRAPTTRAGGSPARRRSRRGCAAAPGPDPNPGAPE